MKDCEVGHLNNPIIKVSQQGGNMINAVRADSPGVKEGKLILRFIDDQNLRYDLALNQRAASDAFAALLRESSNLHDSQQVTVDLTLAGKFGIQPAIGENMTPILLLTLGAISIPLPLMGNGLADLRACIDQLEELSNPSGPAN